VTSSESRYKVPIARKVEDLTPEVLAAEFNVTTEFAERMARAAKRAFETGNYYPEYNHVEGQSFVIYDSGRYWLEILEKGDAQR
jgi:hypothetical protein